MPTYKVYHHNITMALEKKESIAKAITELHTKITGADNFFAQVIFHEIYYQNHFIGGKISKDKQIFIIAHIREGRPKNLRKQLLHKITEKISTILSLDNSQIWIYIEELSHINMVEYGHILPEPGKEKQWVENLDFKLKSKILNN
tara:strand:+ start:2178 stop:2612 length:435 start_codon:yes stop_codon:yes gene_type:complete